jgi:hypothetical protein
VNDKTFAAIEKLKEVELELHRLKNALEMMNRAHDAKKEWVGLTTDEVFELASIKLPHGLFAGLIERKLREKNGA